MTKRDDAKTLLDREVKAGIEIQSRRDKQLFTRLTNTTHDTLVTNWRSGGIMSACNGFVGWYASNMGIKGIESYFTLEKSLRKIDKGHAWVPADSGVDPQYGDILHHYKNGTGLHVDVFIGFTSDRRADRRMIRVAAGQITFHKPRNPDAEYDVLKRVTGDFTYDPKNLFGWLDLERFFDAPPAAALGTQSSWVNGWWNVNDGTQYFYYFFPDGRVQYVKRQPASMLVPPTAPLNTGTYNYLPGGEVFVRWNPAGGGQTEETFTAGSDRTTMTGTSNRYPPLTAKRPS